MIVERRKEHKDSVCSNSKHRVLHAQHRTTLNSNTLIMEKGALKRVIA